MLSGHLAKALVEFCYTSMTPNEIFSSNLWFSPFSQLWATVSREGREDLALREHLGVSTLYNASSTRLSRAKLWWNIWPECTVGKLLKALRFTLNTPVPFLMNSKVWSFETISQTCRLRNNTPITRQMQCDRFQCGDCASWSTATLGRGRMRRSATASIVLHIIQRMWLGFSQ